MSIQRKLFEFRKQAVAVKKNAKNPFFKSNYADINSVIDSINPILDELGIVFTQCPNFIDGVDVLTTRISIADDPKEFIESNVRLLLPSADMQKLGSAITYARRYALISMFALETEDDDGNTASKKVSKKGTKKESTQYNKTPTQKKNEEINYAFEKLAEAKEKGDMELATEVWEWAELHDYTQVKDRHIKLFGN